MTDPKTNAADFNAEVVKEFRANGGQVAAFEGNELLLLTMTGDVRHRRIRRSQTHRCSVGFRGVPGQDQPVIPIFELQRTD